MSISRDEQPLVSVVTPVYNGADYIAECIESVLKQTYENWEYVIVDNCSTDDTLEIARGYEAREPRIRIVTPDVFVGVVESGNRSLRGDLARQQVHEDAPRRRRLFPECLSAWLSSVNSIQPSAS